MISHKEATVPVVTKKNLNYEVLLSNQMKPRFHLEPLKKLTEKGYVGTCAVTEIKEPIERLEQMKEMYPKKKMAKKAYSLKTISDHFKQVESGEDRNRGSDKTMLKVYNTEIGNRTMKKVKVA